MSQQSSPSLLPSDAHLAAIVSSSADGIISKDLNGVVQSWNRAAERIFGYSADEMVGHSIRRLIPDDLQSQEDDILRNIRAGKTVPRFRTRRLHKDGDLVPVAITVSPVHDATGEIVGASKIVTDLSGHVEAEQKLAESEARFRALADNIPQLAWMANAEGLIFWYNQRWYDFTGTNLPEMEGWGWRKVHHPDFVDGVAERFRDAISKGEPWEDTFPLRNASGDYRWFLSRARPIRDESGVTQLWFGTNTDVTRQRENEQQIEILMAEVNHRAKNLLALVQSIVHRTSAGVDPDFIAGLERRIAALASNQDLLIKRGWKGAHVADVVGYQLHFVQDVYADRIRVDSVRDDLVLRPAAAEALGLAIHELATNAVKYGSLSNESGVVDVSWRVSDEELQFRWAESGGPATHEPQHSGFGTILITRNPQSAMGGETDLDYRPDGLVWRLRAPLERIREKQFVDE